MPGPRPVFCPVFPDDFLQEALSAVRRRTVPYQTVQRYRLVLLLSENPHLSHEKAGEYVGLSGRQVRRWRKRWASGDFSIADVQRRGRKSCFSPSGPCYG